MSDSIMFDNFIITNDKAVADDYARQTWEFKKVVRANKEVRRLIPHNALRHIFLSVLQMMTAECFNE